MGTVYQRTEDGNLTIVTVGEAMAEVNHAMMDGKRHVREMSSGRGQHRIQYTDGRQVRMIAVDASQVDEVRDWAGTYSRRNRLHRFGADGKARCNAGIRHVVTGVVFRSRSEVESSEYADLYTFCARCEVK